MAIPVLAILSALSMIEKFIEIPLVKRAFINIAKGTANKIDDKIVNILFKVAEADIPKKLEAAQRKYDKMSEDDKVAKKENWEEVPEKLVEVLNSDEIKRLLGLE